MLTKYINNCSKFNIYIRIYFLKKFFIRLHKPIILKNVKKI